MADYAPDADWQFDELVVDEGQDFQPSWRDILLKLLRPAARAWWLEDPMQNLYGRPPVDLPGWVILHAQTNYRTPRDVLAYLQRLVGASADHRGRQPPRRLRRGNPHLRQPRRPDGRTKPAITRGLGAGFKKDMISVVTFRGREHSRLSRSTNWARTPSGLHRPVRPAGQPDLFRRRTVHRLGPPLQGPVRAVHRVLPRSTSRNWTRRRCGNCSWG